jgi:hypothetical protein
MTTAGRQPYWIFGVFVYAVLLLLIAVPFLMTYRAGEIIANIDRFADPAAKAASRIQAELSDEAAAIVGFQTTSRRYGRRSAPAFCWKPEFGNLSIETTRRNRPARCTDARNLNTGNQAKRFGNACHAAPADIFCRNNCHGRRCRAQRLFLS